MTSKSSEVHKDILYQVSERQRENWFHGLIFVRCEETWPGLKSCSWWDALWMQLEIKVQVPLWWFEHLVCSFRRRFAASETGASAAHDQPFQGAELVNSCFLLCLNLFLFELYQPQWIRTRTEEWGECCGHDDADSSLVSWSRPAESHDGDKHPWCREDEHPCVVTTNLQEKSKLKLKGQLYDWLERTHGTHKTNRAWENTSVFTDKYGNHIKYVFVLQDQIGLENLNAHVPWALMSFVHTRLASKHNVSFALTGMVFPISILKTQNQRALLWTLRLF